MTYGLAPPDWNLVNSLAIERLKNAGCDVWIFGSRAKGLHQTFSDLDVCYASKSSLPSGLLSEIKEMLEESNLPIKIDLVDWNEMAHEYREDILAHRKKVS